MLNSIAIVGRLTRNPEVKNLDGGKTVATFTLAVQRNKDDVDFIPCEVWNKSAISVRDYVTKGSLVGVTGSLRIDNYEVDGNRKTYSKIVANKVDFILLKSREQDDDNEPGPTPDDYMTDEERANQ